MKESKHMPALDGLRGVAAIGVLLSHAIGIFAFMGSLSVAVFFALSGFLMAFLYGRKSFTIANAFSYGVSRFARIAPLYLFVILASLFIRTHIDGNFIYAIDYHNILRHLLFSGSESVFWSIPPEVQFYVFFLVLWWAVFAAGRRSYGPAIITAILILLMLGVNFVHPLPGTTLPNKLPFFLLGAAAGLTRSWLVKWPVREWLMSLFQYTLLLAAAFNAFCLYGVAHDTNAVYLSAPMPVICAMMVLAFSLPTRFSVNSFGNRYMRLLGAWSFAIYLLHQPSLYWAARIQAEFHLLPAVEFPLGVIFVLTLAALSQFMLERPAQFLLKAWSEKVSGARSRQAAAVQPLADELFVPVEPGLQNEG